MPTIETSMTDAAKAVNLASDTYGSTNALYKKAAAIASYKLGRGLSEHDVLLVEMSILEAKREAKEADLDRGSIEHKAWYDTTVEVF